MGAGAPLAGSGLRIGSTKSFASPFLMRSVRIAFSFATSRVFSRFASFAVRTASGPQKYFRCVTRLRGRSFFPHQRHGTIARLTHLRHSPSTTGYVVRITSAFCKVEASTRLRSA